MQALSREKPKSLGSLTSTDQNLPTDPAIAQMTVHEDRGTRYVHSAGSQASVAKLERGSTGHHTNVTKTSNTFMDTMKGSSKQDYY